MIDPASIALGAALALAGRWALQQLRSPRLSEYPLDGSQWVIDGQTVTVRRVYRPGSLGISAYISIGQYESIPWREFRRRARPPGAEHLVQQMRRPRLVKTEPG